MVILIITAVGAGADVSNGSGSITGEIATVTWAVVWGFGVWSPVAG